MSQSKKTYTLGKIKQLIDLNGDSTNFDLSFTVTCHDDTPFNLLVVDQTTLDNTPELQYKEANKTISGNIVADKNVYQNYFLILKSEKTCSVDVELTKKVLPQTPIEPFGTNPLDTSPKYNRQIPASNTTSWKKIGLIALVIIIGLCVLWWLYKLKGSDKSNDTPYFNESPKQLGKLHGNTHIDHTTSFNKKVSPVLSSARRSAHSSAHSSARSSTHSSARSSARSSTHSSDHRGYKPTVSKYQSNNVYNNKGVMSMSQASHRSDKSVVSGRAGNSLLHRLRKFAR